jgi:hypothetical protein
MPKVVVLTIAIAAMKLAAAENIGEQRAASQRSTGKTRASGSAAVHDSRGVKTASAPLTAPSNIRAAVPSASSGRAGIFRQAAANPISSGASARMPRASEANQCCHYAQDGRGRAVKQHVAQGSADARYGSRRDGRRE